MRLRFVLLFILGWSWEFPLFAQSSLPVDAGQHLVQPALALDTANAIHNLFEAKRHQASFVTELGIATGIVGVAISITGVVAINALSKLITNRKPDQGTLVLYSIPIVSPGLVISGLGSLKRHRYSQRREAALLAAYQQGQTLPTNVVRQLKRHYF